LSVLPALVQFDGDTRLASKLAKMASLGFYFLKEADGQGRLECDPTAVKVGLIYWLESIIVTHQVRHLHALGKNC